jgi:hypothetical protein
VLPIGDGHGPVNELESAIGVRNQSRKLAAGCEGHVVSRPRFRLRLKRGYGKF